MSFISNASGITLGEGTFNNVQGNLVNIFQSGGQRADIGALLECLLGDQRRWRGDEEAARGRRQEGEDEGLEIIRPKDLKLTHEIGRGQGYLLHAGQVKDRAMIVKVFNPGARAREHLEATMTLSKGLLHPNVLRIHGTSSPTSPSQFITYQDAYWKTAEGPLAAALRDGIDTSVVLGFKLVAGLSSGINYLSGHDISLSLGAEDFDVFLDMNDRFLLSINPPVDATPAYNQRDVTRSAWTLFNALCQKVLRSANRVLHDQDIERTPAVFDTSRPPSLRSSPVHSLGQTIAQDEEAIPADCDVAASVPPRREFVWRTMDVPQSLASIATQIARDLDLRRASITRLARRDGRSIHRCPGYLREEVTLATRTADSAIISHDVPAVHEVCSVCHEVVISGEVFDCVCGQKGRLNPAAARYILLITFPCRTRFASHCKMSLLQVLESQGLWPFSRRVFMPFVHILPS
ncbi:hypothetical protein FB45DRAFT_259199 [Roridomyces roridus]|uniref:Protein kinase domain-containing protein n=1 Tax=Roridomyces roridus TaxID=1738132 RepID=A0AAD7B936_9AGAR|nr:hypothetical protein FB45DRAFT_259199 [Roridomyces roridus]